VRQGCRRGSFLFSYHAQGFSHQCAEPELVAESEQGRGIVGVIDGFSPKGVEGEADKKERREMLRRFGYKF